jgi:Tfp pilus assembly protein PilF
MDRRLRLVALLAPLLISACATPPPPPPSVSITRLYAQPAERSLVDGIRAYDEGQHTRAEQLLRKAVSLKLADPADTATAWKYLAFIACSYSRPAECEEAFIAALQADPGFRLGEAELGHPLWGPVYDKVVKSAPVAATAPANGSAR